MVHAGGRIKAAGVSLGHLYQITSDLATSPSQTYAERVVTAFAKLRDKPPGAVRTAYFPKTLSDVKRLTKSGPALLRPFLKTDQGPGGNFLGMRIGGDGNISPVIVTETSGMAIMEPFFARQIEEVGSDTELTTSIAEVQALFQAGDDYEARLALERLMLCCDRLGIHANRKADVGIEPFFFIRPASGKSLVEVPTNPVHKIGQEVEQRIRLVELQALVAQGLVAEGYPVSERAKITEVARQESTSYSGDFSPLATHFQVDVIIRADGSYLIEEVHFPDVGLFLTQLETENSVFTPIQGIVHEIRPVVIESVLSKLREYGSREVVILTRDEVIDDEQDVLELTEIAALQESLSDCGVKTSVSGISQIDSLPNGTVVLPLNLDKHTTSFDKLLERTAHGELQPTTNPFIRLFEEELTGLTSIKVTSSELATLTSVVSNIDANGRLALTQYLALQEMLSRLGVGREEDILYFSVPGSVHKIPAFRHDVRSIQIATRKVNSAVEANGNSGDVILQSLRFKPEDAVIIGEDGPRLAAFRFMFVRR